MDDLTQFIQCDVELEVSGPSPQAVVSWTAAALRRIADRLEQGEFGDGHHEVGDNLGRPIGSVYFDFTEGDHFGDD